MKSLLAIIHDGSKAVPTGVSSAPSAPSQSVHTQTAGGDPDVDTGVAAMKIILERLARSADHLIDETRTDRPLREAMMMQPIPDGVQMGGWQIKTKTDSGRKLYDVVKSSDATPIATDLTIYEAARGLVQALNEGLPINNPLVRALLAHEAEHAHAIHDAIHARHALQNRQLSETRRSLMEDKYSAAVRQAVTARHRLRAIIEQGSAG